MMMVRMLATMIHECLKTGGVADAGYDNHTIGREQSRLKGSHRQKLALYTNNIFSDIFFLVLFFVARASIPQQLRALHLFFLRKFASLLKCLPRHSLALVKIKK